MDSILYRDGVSSTVVDDLITEAGVARGTLYKNFRTRDELIDAYLERRHQRTMTVLEQIATGRQPLSHQIDAVFDHLATLTGEDLFRGCAFVVAAAELPDDQRPARRWAQLHKDAVFETFHQMFASHGVREATSMAEQLMILYDGALVASYLRPGSDAISRAREMARSLFAVA